MRQSNRKLRTLGQRNSPEVVTHILGGALYCELPINPAQEG